MKQIYECVKQKGYTFGSLTLGETIEIAGELNLRVSDVIIAEAMDQNAMTREEVLDDVLNAFAHNLYAAEVGITSGSSFLLGTIPQELAADNFSNRLIEDDFINKILVYTLAAQVGNHSCGLQPCAGTGDSCTYTGLYRALQEFVEDKEERARAVAVMLKVGTIFRAGKTTTGCNMEGFGAGSAATAATLVELHKGSPEAMAKAVVLALSPTIGTPCTPRVMVAGLCTTHIGGGVLIGNLAANLAMKTGIPVNVPVDVMIAMAAAIHPVSAEQLVPIVIRYMQPFFKKNLEVEYFIEEGVREQEHAIIEKTMVSAIQEARALAKKANSIVKPFGEAVVGGSSQAVGSPTNTARIAHALAKGEITGVKIELYAELFARRGINVPGILMAAVLGASTDNGNAYREIMDKVRQKKINVEIVKVDEPQKQRITIFATEQNSMVEALNRGGARLVLQKASPSLEEARFAAQSMGIVLVD
ncbi:L-serine ammonia-lyase, iron-sulfur-dependent, subunit alpha [Desulfitobacterium sp.]|uniref:L-serine ammonia-lyase, iron-sulfur-dependent, subunit alpha n=1 Tax=Desulfitobacterium sp. TaxID=49981 RepID=UPI002B21433A|nr:L-serine ammonia-lyase, iron-sulfur-dependent, subunit alpha [Desulfitobacterium sp.]MEA4901160.1 L-serine ammonia-lyase, iron-sulfur-dependent, subunit alpha [Desulfitobacterium sp.]